MGIFDIAINLVTDGKFIGLLTIMFGIGLEIQRQSAIRRGTGWPGRYPWRTAILVLDGLLNYIFIFEFDVLMGYGLTALAVSAIMITGPRAQKIWMYLGLAVHVVSILAIQVLMSGLPFLTGADPEDPEAMREFADSAERAGPDPAGGGAAATGLGSTDSYWAMVHERVVGFIGGRGEIPVMFLMGIGLFLVGAHLFRAGIFEERGHRLRKRTMLLAFGVGLPIDWALRILAVDSASGITRYITSTAVAFGLLAAVAAFYVHRTGTGWIGTPLAAVGRMALTCYILQNLLASIIFYDWGFGLAARIAGGSVTLWTMVVYVLLSAFLIGLSMLWLRRFRRGPVEWLWDLGYRGIGTLLDRRQERRAERSRAGGQQEPRAIG